MTIRRMKENDYDDVVNVWLKAGLDYRPAGRDSRAAVIKQLASSYSAILVAEEGKSIVGVVFGTHDSRKGWINRLAVLPERQGNGIAKALIDGVEQELISAGIKIFAATIFADNSASIRTAEKMGYKCLENVKYFSKKTDPDY
jgi:N-acetylglutamate synthase